MTLIEPKNVNVTSNLRTTVKSETAIYIVLDRSTAQSTVARRRVHVAIGTCEGFTVVYVARFKIERSVL